MTLMTSGEIEPFEPVVEDWQRALAIVAHPDDLEFGAAAAIARWTGQGKQVTYVLLTSGEAGIDGMEPDRARAVREEEQRASAALVGVDSVEFLGLPDGILEYGVPLRRLLAATIRQHRPEIVLTNNFREGWGGGVLNQADHIATGRATLDAVRDAANRWIFPEQLSAGDGLEPWSGVRQVWAPHSPLSTHGVDVTATFDTGVRSLQAHAEYLRGLGWPEDAAEEFLASSARLAGSRMGCTYAASFEVFRIND
jgi:LmbE family N-acetylglucosaminyl deacetylase